METQPILITESLFQGSVSVLLTYFTIRIVRYIPIDRPEYPTQEDTQFMEKLATRLPPLVGSIVTASNLLFQVINSYK